MQPESVEIEDGLIKITTLDGAQFWYYQDERGVMRLGYPVVQMYREYRVKMFVPRPDGIPVILYIGE